MQAEIHRQSEKETERQICRLTFVVVFDDLEFEGTALDRNAYVALAFVFGDDTCLSVDAIDPVDLQRKKEQRRTSTDLLC